MANPTTDPRGDATSREDKSLSGENWLSAQLAEIFCDENALEAICLDGARRLCVCSTMCDALIKMHAPRPLCSELPWHCPFDL